MSFHSRGAGSRKSSRLSKRKNSNVLGDTVSAADGSTSQPRRKLKKSSSEKRLVMEKKLTAYYQSLIKPVDEWGPFFDEQIMLDGTDVDA